MKLTHTVSAFAGVFLLIVLASTAAFSQGGGNTNNPLNVKVINTTANPVPVTGTISGTITGDVSVINTPSVSVVNTPSVTIDPSGNAVRVAGRGPALVWDSDYLTLPTSGFILRTIDVANFSKFRVYVYNQGTDSATIGLNTSLPGDVLIGNEVFQLAPGGRGTALYELIAPTMVFRVSSCDGCRVRMWVYGY